MSGSPAATTPKSRIPRLQRSPSFHEVPGLRSREKTPSTEEDLEALDDVGSLDSVSSVVSCMLPGQYAKAVAAAKSAFSISRHKHSRCVANCSPTPEKETYLTPTQRANRTIRQLRAMLADAKSDLQYKDFEIQRLTKEIVQLRIEHAQCKAVDGENQAPPASLADSGLFDDSSKESLAEVKENEVFSWPLEKRRLTKLHAEQIADLKRHHLDEVQTIRSKLTDRLEQALEQLGEANSRYSTLAASYDSLHDQLIKAEAEVKTLRQGIEEKGRIIAGLQSELEQRETHEYEAHEEEAKQITQLEEQLQQHQATAEKLQQLQQELSTLQAAATARKEASNSDPEHSENKNVTGTLDLEHQLSAASAELLKIREIHDRQVKDSHDSAITLQFLRSAVFYLLTDKDNHAGHLRAVQSILDFSSEEKSAVEKAMRYSYLL